MTLPSDYLKSVRDELYNVKRALRSGNVVEAFEALLQAETQITYSIDEIEKMSG
jgi:hypothetical protein